EITSNPQLLAGIDSARRELESYRKSKSPQPAVPGSTSLGKDKLPLTAIIGVMRTPVLRGAMASVDCE
ncbi:MAG TPA: hypothetical protein VND62_05540, partial [Acidimicrobiales bacterium]|nr:hypothetical protein [Acidimicrobiales bacterium]